MYAKREALIKRRNQLGLSQKAMARQLGIPCETYASIEKGVCNPSIENYHKIGKALGINAFVLMNRINEDLNIYDKSEPLKVKQISFRHGGGVDCINAMSVEDSSGIQKDLSIDEFNNILYYRYKNGYSLNINYQAHDCEEGHKTNKRQALIQRRNQIGLSQQDMAEQLGMPCGTYYDIENGRSNPSIKTFNSLKRVLGVNAFVFMSSTKYDLNIYDKNEPLTLIWIFVSRGWDCIDMLRLEDSQGTRKDLTLDEFSNVLYYRYINKYSINTTYKAHGSEELRLVYVKDKSQSLLNWCLENGEFGKYIIENVQLPYGITLADFSKGSHKKLDINCPKHGIYSQVISDITRQKHGCPKCTASGTSYTEQFIYWSLKQLYPKCENRHKIEGLEVDVFIPEKNTCIEYNGEHWHEDKEYMDSYKREYIERLGSNFITVNEHYENGDTIFIGNDIDFYYGPSNKNDRLKELVQYIVDELLQADSSLIDFKAVEENAWEYSKGKIAYEDSVAYLFTKLTEEWDSSNFIKPEDVTPGSGQRIKWVCKHCGNQWQAMIAARTHYKTGCTSCHFNIFDGKIHSWEEKAKNADNNVVRLYPELVKEFLPELNEGKHLENYTSGARAKMKWKCQNCGNEWITGIKYRTYKKSGCPACGHNTFTDKINPRSKRTIHHTTPQKKQPIAVVNGVEIYI